MRWLGDLQLGPWSILKKSFAEFSDDDMPTYASALAYRGLFSLFPFLLFLIALVGFLGVPQFFDWLHQQAALAMPAEAMSQVDDILDQLERQRGGLLSFGILVALWSASAGVRVTMNAMNRAYDVSEGRPLWKLFGLSVLYTIGAAILLLSAAALMIIGPQIMEWFAAQFGLQEVFVVLWNWLRWPVVALLLMFAVAMIYYIAPDVRQEFRFITPGSVIAVLVWIAASVAFGFYVSNFGNYGKTYGSIGAIIVLLLYFYISAAVLLFGAELNSVIEHASTQGKDAGEKHAHDATASSAPGSGTQPAPR